MATARKAAAKSKARVSKPATTAEEAGTPNGSPELRASAEAMPARASEAQNGIPSEGPDPEIGMTMVADRSPKARAEGDAVRMRHSDGHEADIEPADVESHKRSGWVLVEKE